MSLHDLTDFRYFLTATSACVEKKVHYNNSQSGKTVDLRINANISLKHEHRNTG